MLIINENEAKLTAKQIPDLGVAICNIFCQV